MGRREARRLGLIQAAIDRKVTNREGAQALELSLRQFKRLRSRVARLGAAGVVHGNRGRQSPRRLVATVREAVQELLTQSIARLNDCHIADLLETRGVAVSAASVRRIRNELGLAAKRRRRPPQHRRRRLRAACAGALVQIDGSPFAWWDEAAPPCWTVGAIDDATGSILALTFQPGEDVHAYATLFQRLFGDHGLPVRLYGDHSSVLVRNDEHWTVDEQLSGAQDPTQIGQALRELGVHYDAAHSPQAKGRIERLWGTLQDRLSAELRLARIHDRDAAEAFLPDFIRRYNERFAVPARECRSAFRPAPRDLDRILCCRYRRVVARDDTVTIPGRWVQLPAGPRQRSWHKARVEVRELLDGRLLVIHPRHGLLAEQPAPSGPFRLVPRKNPNRLDQARRPAPQPPAPRRVKDRVPGASKARPNSPWRRSYKKIYALHPTHPNPGGVRITDELGGQNH